MAFENSPGVRVNDKTVMSAGVKQDAVGGLTSNAVNCEQPLPNPGRVAGQHSIETPVKVLDQHFQEIPDAPRLDVEVAGRADELRESGFGEGEQFARLEHAGALQIGDCFFDVGPRGVLREDRADRDLKWRITRPPSEMAVVRAHEPVGSAEQPGKLHGRSLEIRFQGRKVCLPAIGQIPNVRAYLMASTVDIIRWAMLVFQVWMLVDAIRREEWFWAVFIGLAVFYWNSFGLSAILYYLLVYRRYSSGPSLSGFELPGTFDRKRIRELEGKIHHLDNAQHYLQLADIYFQQGKYDKAEQTYREAMKRDGDDVDIRAHLGQCLLRLGKAQEALELLQNVAQADPKHDYGFTLMALAETHAKLGSPDSAIQIWERVLENHSYPRARVQLAELLIQKNDIERARSILQETLADEQYSPLFQRRRDRVWIGRAKGLMRQVNARGGN